MQNDYVVDKRIVELQLPENVLITLINRDGKFLEPKGSTRIEKQDRLLILSEKEEVTEIRKHLTKGII